ncbi:MAG: isoprenyl transferase [Bacteroidota bacterium]|nr:isoprenyl transferase [Bacteroidota bacterium]
MDSLLSQIDPLALPKHIAIIMDGNGRWAKKNGRPRLFGHKNGVNTVKEITEACAELGIENLTLFAFSTENWNRPEFEVTGLMNLLVETIKLEIKLLMKNNIRLNAIGNISQLSTSTQKALQFGIEKTKDNTKMCLTIALNYSARWEILNAVNCLIEDATKGKIAGPLDEAQFASFLSTKGMIDPELLIRTSGEHRISNFLLWQLAYTELYFTPVLWPDFNKEHLYEAIINYQHRERRFGMTSDQLKETNSP